jgi:exodeoxyribonuclease VII small subunit
MTEHDPVERFERLAEQLQEQVALLEKNHLTLEEAISAYERSVDLANACHQLLDDAQLRIEKIDAGLRTVKEPLTSYRFGSPDAAALLLGDEDDDLLDLIDEDDA